jgi:hypothetical protein
MRSPAMNPTCFRRLLPGKLEKDKRYPLLLVLPVEVGSNPVART